MFILITTSVIIITTTTTSIMTISISIRVHIVITSIAEQPGRRVRIWKHVHDL